MCTLWKLLVLYFAANGMAIVPYIPPAVIAEIEMRGLTHPRVAVILASPRDESIRPALPALHSDGYLYFTRRSSPNDRRRGCIGDRIYRYPVTAEVAERRFEVVTVQRLSGEPRVWTAFPEMCIQEIQSRPPYVFVRHTVETVSYIERIGDVSRMRNDRQERFLGLIPPERDRTRGAWLDHHAWDYHTRHFTDTGHSRLRPWSLLGFWSSPVRRIEALLRTPSNSNLPTVVSISPSDEDETPARMRRFPDAVERALGTQANLAARFGSGRYLYLTHTGSSETMGGLTIADLAAEEEGRIRIVGQFGLPNSLNEGRARDAYAPNVWAARVLDYAAVTPTGLLLADTTQVATGERALIYHVSPLRQGGIQFVPVVNGQDGIQVRHLRDLSGIQYWNGGFIASFETTGVIAYFGRRSPFPEARFAWRRLNLDGLSDDERARIREEINR